MHVQLWVIEVDIGNHTSEKSFGLVHASFESFDILRGGVTAAIRGLVIGAI
jgi:hypothetical protein